MGCGCGKVNMSGSLQNRATSVSTPKVASNAVCIHKYDELAMLDKKVIALHKKFRFVGNSGYKYAEIQKNIRSWIRNLSKECPDETELKEYSDYINKEYDKYYK